MTASVASNDVSTLCGWVIKLLLQIIEIFVPVSPDLLRCLCYFDEHLQNAYFASGTLLVCFADLFQQIEKNTEIK